MPETEQKGQSPCVCLFSCSVISDSLRPHGLYVAHEVPLSMEFSRREHWSGLPFPFARGSSWLRGRTWGSVTAGRFFTVWATRERALYPPAAAECYPHWMTFVRTAGEKQSFILIASGIVLPTTPKDVSKSLRLSYSSPHEKTVSGSVNVGQAGPVPCGTMLEVEAKKKNQ